MSIPDKIAIEWAADLAAAEEYWFQLPAAVRAQYTGQVVALLGDRIIDTDVTLKALRSRVSILQPNQPVLYIEADAEREPPLVVLSPRLK